MRFQQVCLITPGNDFPLMVVPILLQCSMVLDWSWEAMRVASIYIIAVPIVVPIVLKNFWTWIFVMKFHHTLGPSWLQWYSIVSQQPNWTVVVTTKINLPTQKYDWLAAQTIILIAYDLGTIHICYYYSRHMHINEKARLIDVALANTFYCWAYATLILDDVGGGSFMTTNRIKSKREIT